MGGLVCIWWLFIIMVDTAVVPSWQVKACGVDTMSCSKPLCWIKGQATDLEHPRLSMDQYSWRPAIDWGSSACHHDLLGAIPLWVTTGKRLIAIKWLLRMLRNAV